LSAILQSAYPPVRFEDVYVAGLESSADISIGLELKDLMYVKGAGSVDRRLRQGNHGHMVQIAALETRVSRVIATAGQDSLPIKPEVMY